MKPHVINQPHSNCGQGVPHKAQEPSHILGYCYLPLIGG